MYLIFNLNLCSTCLTPYSYFYRARIIWYVAISIMSTFQWGSWLPQLIQQPSVLWFRHYYFKNGLKSFYKLSVTVQQMALLICYAGLYIQQIMMQKQSQPHSDPLTKELIESNTFQWIMFCHLTHELMA